MENSLIQSTLSQLLEKLQLPFSDITVTQEKDLTRVEIASTEASRIIGWHGETLNSIQHLLKSILRTMEKLERTPFILLDVDGYRKTQEEKVKKIAESKADFVRRTKNRVALSPMSPYFRRIVHLHIADHPDLQDIATESIGEGDYRQIVLRLKNEPPRAARTSGHTGGHAQRGGRSTRQPRQPERSEELSPVIAEDDGLENLDI